eukprot:8705906-Ditylum_brightwellii.AAC.1
MRTLTTSDEDGTNIHQVKQPGREPGDYSVPKTYHEAIGEMPGTPEEWIKFRRGLAAVLKGQNVTQGPASYA